MRRFLAVVLAAILLVFCGCRNDGGDVFAFPLSTEPLCLDPQTANDEASLTVIASLFEGLVTRSTGGEIQPAAAEWTLSADGLTYTFTLRSAVWSNDKAVTSDDFLFAYERARALDFPAHATAVLREIASVTAPNDTTLSVTLATPNDGFLDALAKGGWYPCPRAFFESCSGGYGMEPTALLQNGPFVLSSWQHDQTLTLRKNPQYRAVAEILPAVVRYAVGKTVTGDFGATGDGAPDGSVITLTDTVRYLWFNTAISPLSSSGVRRALRDTVEWDLLRELLGNTATASYVSPDAVLEGVDYCSPLVTHKTAADRTAFLTALGNMGLTACPILTLLCEDTDQALAQAQLIVQSWQKHLSVYFAIEQVSATALSARLAAGNYHLALAPATATGDSPKDALALFGGTQQNFSRFEDAAWLADVQRAATLADIQAVEQRLYDACPAVPIAVVTREFSLSKEVLGITLEPFTARVDFRRAVRDN